MKLVFASVLLMLALAPADLQAQRVIINGTVVNEVGVPISGANVKFSSLILGASTDINGQYSLILPSSQAHGQTIVLVVKAVGYVEALKSITYSKGTQTHDFLLQPDVLLLDEEVVTGISAATPVRNLTHAVGKLGGDDILRTPAAGNPLAFLQGKMAGVTIFKNSGAPGDSYVARIRGSASITRDASPLVIVDGVILGADLVDIDAFDIEHIEVMKGAAAAAEYGSRAQDGVIQIQTYRGSNQPFNKLRVTVRNEFGINDLERMPQHNKSHNLLTNDSGEFLDPAGNTIEYGPGTVIDTGLNGTSFYDNSFAGDTFNAFDQFFNLGSTYSNYISLSRNGAKTNIHGALSNLREAGVLTGVRGYDRQTARLNLDHRIIEGLSVSISTQFARSSNDSPALSRANALGLTRFNPFLSIQLTNPYSNLNAQDGDGNLPVIADPLAQSENPLYLLENSDLSSDRLRFLGHIGTQYRPTDWVSLEAGLSYDRADQEKTARYESGFLTIEQNPVNEGLMDRYALLREALNYTVAATFRESFGGLNVRSRWQYEHEDFYDLSSLSIGEATNVSRFISGFDTLPASGTGEYVRKILMDAYFATLGLDYKRKFLADGLFRREGNSLFGKDERWQHYYRIGGAYRMSQESWWPIDAFPEFKLHASFGTAGGRPRFNAQYASFGLLEDTIVRRSLSNSTLKPERTTELELGTSLIIADRLFIDVAYATSETEDLLFLVPLPGFFGFESQWQNTGTLENNTLEASLFASLIRNQDVELDIGVVFDKSSQKITNLHGDGFLGGPEDIFYFGAGEKLGAMYGSELITELGSLPAGSDVSYFDINDDGYVVAVGEGNTFRDGLNKQLWGTNVIVDGSSYQWGLPIKKTPADGSEVSRIGNALPDFNIGVPVKFRYKGFYASTLWHAQIGGDIYNFSNQTAYQSGRSVDQDQAGKPDDLKKPALYYEALYDGNSINSHFIEDGTYIKLRELSIGYTFDQTQLSNMFGGLIHQLTISATGRNLFSITDYSGQDPESTSWSNTSGIIGADATLYRVDNFGYPNYRTITGRLEIQF